MGSKEIRSPETAAPERLVLDYKQRKKLGIHFAESDERRFPKAIGGEYVAGGTTPVNIRGRPIEDLSKTGGWIAAFFIFDFHARLKKDLEKKTKLPPRENRVG